MLAWIGTVFGIIGALIVAANIGANDFGYICFTVGALASLVSSIKKGDNANIILWLVFLIINIFGIFSYLKG